MVTEKYLKQVIEQVKGAKGKPVPFADIKAKFDNPAWPPGGAVDIAFVAASTNVLFLEKEGFIRETEEGGVKGYVICDALHQLAAQGKSEKK